jgi:hypothetical protein
MDFIPSIGTELPTFCTATTWTRCGCITTLISKCDPWMTFFRISSSPITYDTRVNWGSLWRSLELHLGKIAGYWRLVSPTGFISTHVYYKRSDGKSIMN